MAREAKSLQVLESEIQSRYPGTTTWEKGDDDHQTRWSDHNENAAGVYCAKDILSDGGMDLQAFVGYIVANPHPNLRYLIYKDKIYERSNGFKARHYNGRYHGHVHVSVGNGPDGRSTSGYDDTSPWGVSNSELPGGIMLPKYGDKNSSVSYWQYLLNKAGANLSVDGDYRDKTKGAVHAWHKAYLKASGSNATPEDGSEITHSIAWELQVSEMKNRIPVKGDKGDPGAPGAPGKPGKDGVLKLPAAVQITGQVTAVGTGK